MSVPGHSNVLQFGGVHTSEDASCLGSGFEFHPVKILTRLNSRSQLNSLTFHTGSHVRAAGLDPAQGMQLVS